MLVVPSLPRCPLTQVWEVDIQSPRRPRRPVPQTFCLLSHCQGRAYSRRALRHTGRTTWPRSLQRVTQALLEGGSPQSPRRHVTSCHLMHSIARGREAHLATTPPPWALVSLHTWLVGSYLGSAAAVIAVRRSRPNRCGTVNRLEDLETMLSFPSSALILSHDEESGGGGLLRIELAPGRLSSAGGAEPCLRCEVLSMNRFASPQHSSCRREAYRALPMGTSARARSALTGAKSLGSQTRR